VDLPSEQRIALNTSISSRLTFSVLRSAFFQYGVPGFRFGVGIRRTGTVAGDAGHQTLILVDRASDRRA
jgi:hypothetical protein